MEFRKPMLVRNEKRNYNKTMFLLEYITLIQMKKGI